MAHRVLIVIAVLSVAPLWANGFAPNGDFEGAFTNGRANGWSAWQGGWSNTITYARDTSGHLAGNAAQCWGRGDSLRVHGGPCIAVGVTPGVMYEVIAWLRMDTTDGGAWLEAGVDTTGQLSNGEAASISYTKLEPQGNRKWHRYRRLVKATGGTLSFFAKFGHYNQPAGAHWAWIDNVTIQPRTVLEAEDYTNAYDTTAGNAGGAYRSGNVDIGALPGNTGYFVGWTANGEWLEWSNVGSPGVDHVLAITYSAYENSVVQLNVNNANVTGNLTLPKTGWWDTYRQQVAPAPIWLPAGNHTVRLVFNTAVCNIDRIELIPITAGPLLQAEDYASAYDTTPGNTGGQYRAGDVDIELGVEGYDVGWTAAGEWLEFAVAGDARAYAAVVRYSGMSTGTLHFAVNGYNVTGTVSLPATGGWQVWKSILTPVFTLPTGSSALRVNLESGGFNLNYFALVPLGGGSAGSDLLAGVHFAGPPNATDGINAMAGWRGAGNWIYATEFFISNNRDPDSDGAFINEMTNWINGYLKPLYNNRIRPQVRIDHIGGETLPRLLSGGALDNGAIDRYVRTFRKFAQLADANGVPVRQFIVANEMNLKSEANGFANGYLPEWYYVYVYDLVRNTMTSQLGPGYEVLVGAVSPISFSVDPLQTPPSSQYLYSIASKDGLVYLEEVCKELKRKGTQNVGFALHAYADFDTRQDFTIDFLWTLRKQLEIIERTHTVTPYGQSSPVTIGGFATAPAYVTEWNRHTPAHPSGNRAQQETWTSQFIRRAMLHVTKYNRDRMIWDNVSNVWRTYDHRDVRHNFHPIKGMSYFVFDQLGGPWLDYSLKEWKTLSGSATGVNDMWNVYQAEIGKRDPGGL